MKWPSDDALAGCSSRLESCRCFGTQSKERRARFLAVFGEIEMRRRSRRGEQARLNAKISWLVPIETLVPVTME
jgi:hypothetical protein